MNDRQFTLIDKICIQLDQATKTVFSDNNTAEREYPAEGIAEAELREADRDHIAGLMRVNHTGEVCAQALYQGQALTARTTKVKEKMQESADEEVDHLAWCEQRLSELDSHTSYLNPFWYLGSYLIGAFAGLAGDKWSLGFVAETERQVVKHLEKHLGELPEKDKRTASVIGQMQEDEEHHATVAMEVGAVELPKPVKSLMRIFSKIMTSTAYKI